MTISRAQWAKIFKLKKVSVSGVYEDENGIPYFPGVIDDKRTSMTVFPESGVIETYEDSIYSISEEELLKVVSYMEKKYEKEFRVEEC